MQNTFFTVFLFITVLFFYIHITAAWKTSNDLEIYETDYKSPAQLQEVCAVKQPVLFEIPDPVVTEFVERFQVARFEKYDNIDICVKASADYRVLSTSSKQGPDSVDAVPMTLRSARRLLTTDTGGKYFSEKNHAFLEESGLDRLSHSVDAFLKPPLSAYSKHDIVLGSAMASTPLRYRLESHNYIAVTRGKIRVKMCPPKYGKILATVADYEHYEFVSPVDVWSASQPNPEEKDILSKIKFLEFEVFAGTILFIPPYWWYSIRFSGDADTTVAGFTYDVTMNVLAQSKHWSLYYLQQSNIKTKPARTFIPAVDSAQEKERERDEPTSSTEESSQPQMQPKHTEIVTNAGIYKVNSS